MNAVAKEVNQTAPKSFRFDIFKGSKDASGKVAKVKSVGSAHLTEGCKTYTLYLKTFLNDVFYILPEQKPSKKADYVILTREVSKNPARKYFWNNVGSADVLSGENAGLAQLTFDLLGTQDIYLNLYPKNTEGESK